MEEGDEMEFSVEEMTQRLTRLRAAMDGAGMDCMLITGIENFSYFSGVPTSLYQSRRPWCAVIPLSGEPVALMKQGAAAKSLELQGFFKHVQTYALPVSSELPRMIADLIKGFGARRLGCELGLEMRLGLPLNDFNAVVGLIPGVELLDGAGVIWSLRKIKSREEAARMKRACEITGSTRQQVFQEVQPGMTEADVAQLWARRMYEAGGERPSFIYVNSGDTASVLPSTTKKLQRGETLWLDGGVYVKGYTCDFSRVATLGPPSARQRALHQDAVEVTNLVLEQIRPGVLAADLARLAFREMTRRGHPNSDTAGHGMGMLINEPPLLAIADDTVLTEGLLVGVELGPAESAGFFRWEQLAHVTKTGYDLLSAEPSTLVVLDF
jgi:Xaa-Pro dipeptidase